MSQNIDIEALKQVLRQRKQFAIYLDTAKLIEEFNSEVEEEVGINLTYSDTIYSAFNVLKELFNTVSEEQKVVLLKVYADAIAHKVLRHNINKIDSNEELMKLIALIKKNKELFVALVSHATGWELEFVVDRVIKLLEEFEKVAIKEFEVAVVNVFRKELSKRNYTKTDKIKSLITLKKYLKNLDKYKVKEVKEEKQLDLTTVIKSLEDLLSSDELKLDDIDFSDIQLNIEKKDGSLNQEQ